MPPGSHPRAWPVSRRNSTVLGSDARGPGWDRWWDHGADWDSAYPVRGGGACLHVPCRPVREGDAQWWDGTEVFRVRPQNERGRPVKLDGVWHWDYGPPRVDKLTADPTVEKINALAKALSGLLDDPHPGLWSWQESRGRIAAELRDLLIEVTRAD